MVAASCNEERLQPTKSPPQPLSPSPSASHVLPWLAVASGGGKAGETPTFAVFSFFVPGPDEGHERASSSCGATLRSPAFPSAQTSGMGMRMVPKGVEGRGPSPTTRRGHRSTSQRDRHSLHPPPAPSAAHARRSRRAIQTPTVALGSGAGHWWRGASLSEPLAALPPARLWMIRLSGLAPRACVRRSRHRHGWRPAGASRGGSRTGLQPPPQVPSDQKRAGHAPRCQPPRRPLGRNPPSPQPAPPPLDRSHLHPSFHHGCHPPSQATGLSLIARWLSEPRLPRPTAVTQPLTVGGHRVGSSAVDSTPNEARWRLRADDL